MRERGADERGWVLLTAVVVMTMIMVVGLAIYSTVDVQTSQSAAERQQESVFNLSEAALQQEAYVLGFNWPGTQSSAYPASCTPSSSTAGQCPSPSTLLGASGNFTQADYNSGVTWEVRVRDNCAPTPTQTCAATTSDFYSSGVQNAPTYDANGDGKVWIWARATKAATPGGYPKQRTIVALVKREKLNEGIPPAVLRAYNVSTTPGASRTIIDSTGTEVVLRCNTSASGCPDLKNSSQLQPSGTVVQDPTSPPPPTVNLDQLKRFKAAAQSNGTYYTSCPSSLTGAIVYIDVPMGTQCSLSGNTVVNSPTSPGLLVMPKGTFSMTGNAVFYGVIYMGNCVPENCTPSTSPPPVLQINGSADVIGGVIVDGPGTVSVGANGSAGPHAANLTYDPNAFLTINTYGTAGLVQNTWQELPPGG